MLWTDGNGHWTNNVRTARDGNYYYPSARELYNWIDEKTDETNSWDAVPWEAYDYLCDLCGVDIDECEDTQVLMDKCLAEIEKEEKE